MFALRRAAGVAAAPRAAPFASAAAAVNLKEPLSVPVARPASLPVKGRAPELGTATLDNGVRVAAFETYGPVATIAIAVQAGSRFETRETIGAAQALKHFGFRSTAHRSAVRFAREIEAIGGTLSTTATRELVVFSADVLRDAIPDAVDVLVDVVRATRFTDYEVADIAEVAKSESLAALANPETRIVEALHRTAFRDTLGNSLYTDADDAGEVSADALRQFYYGHATAARVAIVGAGIGLGDLKGLAQKGLGSLAGAAPTTAKAKYQGGDARIEAFRDPISRFALGFSGPSLGAADLSAFSVLSQILGGESFVKWGGGASSLSRTAAKLSGSATLSSFLLPYSDAGLFGIYVEAPSAGLNAAITAGVAELKKAAKEISAADLARGKAQAKRVVLSGYETRGGAVDDLARQASATGKVRPLADTLAAIDKVTADDVVRAASAALKSKPSAVAYGDIHEAPLSVTLGL